MITESISYEVGTTYARTSGGFITKFKTRKECENFVERVRAVPELLRIDFIRSIANYSLKDGDEHLLF